MTDKIVTVNVTVHKTFKYEIEGDPATEEGREEIKNVAHCWLIEDDIAPEDLTFEIIE